MTTRMANLLPPGFFNWQDFPVIFSDNAMCIAIKRNSGCKVDVIKGHKMQVGLVHMNVAGRYSCDTCVLSVTVRSSHFAHLSKELQPSHIGMKLHLYNEFHGILIQGISNIIYIMWSYSAWKLYDNSSHACDRHSWILHNKVGGMSDMSSSWYSINTGTAATGKTRVGSLWTFFISLGQG